MHLASCYTVRMRTATASAHTRRRPRRPRRLDRRLTPSCLRVVLAVVHVRRRPDAYTVVSDGAFFDVVLERHISGVHRYSTLAVLVLSVAQDSVSAVLAYVRPPSTQALSPSTSRSASCSTALLLVLNAVRAVRARALRCHGRGSRAHRRARRRCARGRQRSRCPVAYVWYVHGRGSSSSSPSGAPPRILTDGRLSNVAQSVRFTPTLLASSPQRTPCTSTVPSPSRLLLALATSCTTTKARISKNHAKHAARALASASSTSAIDAAVPPPTARAAISASRREGSEDNG